jgi:hypothetical protein
MASWPDKIPTAADGSFTTQSNLMDAPSACPLSRRGLKKFYRENESRPHSDVRI